MLGGLPLLLCADKPCLQGRGLSGLTAEKCGLRHDGENRPYVLNNSRGVVLFDVEVLASAVAAGAKKRLAIAATGRSELL